MAFEYRTNFNRPLLTLLAIPAMLDLLSGSFCYYTFFKGDLTMSDKKNRVTRRHFLQATSLAAASVTVIPGSAMGFDKAAPSDRFTGALIGCGGRGGGTFNGLGPNVERVAECDVKFASKADNKKLYTDYRWVLERKDIDLIAIATPPGWHAAISIAAMEAGKDVLCEKPMTRYVSEGFEVAEVERRTGQIYQIGTYGRFGADQNIRKLYESGLLKKADSTFVQSGGVKVKQWSGKVKYDITEIPESLDWPMYCGPAPVRAYNANRVGMGHRGYWDYDGGGLGDMLHHKIDKVCYAHARDKTAPVKITPYAPPAHPRATGMWGSCVLDYADGFKIILDSNEWGKSSGEKSKNLDYRSLQKMLSEEEQKKLDALPDLPKLVPFPEAIRTRKQAGGHAEASARVALVYHLANVAFRTGRTLNFDPETLQVVGDDEANRLICQAVRAPWRL